MSTSAKASAHASVKASAIPTVTATTVVHPFTVSAVGIDVSKGKSTVMVMRPLGEIVTKPFDVLHTKEGLSELITHIQSLQGETRVVMEHTGRYYEPIAQMLHEAGIFVCAVNPLLINQYGNNTLRKVKTDKADAIKIAKYALDNWHELRQYDNMDTTRYQLKTMNRQHALYNKQRTALKNNLIALLDVTYPGVNTLFTSPVRPNGSQKWVDFVMTFRHADCVRSLSLNAFTKRYEAFCKKHGYNFREGAAEKIYDFTKNLVTVSPNSEATKMMIVQGAKQLHTISQTVESFATEMQRLASTLPEYEVVMEMYGAGKITGPQLMAELGDITRFAHRSAITAFAGVDPGKNQSGNSEVKSVPSSKRGSPRLRQTLFIIMTVLLKNAPQDDPVYQFMDKKRREGKPYYVYMTAGANKFLRIYYGKVRERMRELSPDSTTERE